MRTPGVPSELVSQIEAAARVLREGGLVIYPTETFYGLGAAVSRPDAVHRIGALKGREGGKPMAVIVADEASARSLWREVPKAADLYIRQFWPGPLTLVLPAKPGLPFEIASTGEVGVRVSSDPVARELARLVGPIISTSANLSGNREASLVKHIEAKLRESVNVVIDAGRTPGGKPSTVLGFKDGQPVVLREGAIQQALLDACKP
ncbi:MAG TPA: L-threonylcarbamoyladenylate synthase [Myxococcales bacterium]|jgi:L-threonylcarbamoyladenylate synthase